MTIRIRAKRTAAASLGAAAALAATVFVGPQAQAAPGVYWTFKSLSYDTCIAGNSYGDAYTAGCDGGTNKQWQFITNYSDGYNLMKNRFTGKCLATDHKAGGPNAVWLSTCNTAADGQRFHYDGSVGLFTTIWGTKLRTDNSGTLVAGSELAYWDGWTG